MKSIDETLWEYEQMLLNIGEMISFLKSYDKELDKTGF